MIISFLYLYEDTPYEMKRIKEYRCKPLHVISECGVPQRIQLGEMSNAHSHESRKNRLIVL